jgi:hypothetical protein
VVNLSSASRNASVTVPNNFQDTYTEMESGGSVSLGQNYNPNLAAWGYRVLSRQGTLPPTTRTATFSIAAGTHDQQVLRSGTLYPPNAGTFSRQATGAIVEASNNYQGSGGYYVRNALLRWDTLSIPDNATIKKATLRFWCTVRDPSDARNFVAEYWGWNGTSLTDWSGTLPAAPIFQAPVSNITSGAWNSIAFTNLGGISKTGWTLIRCYISGGIPTGHNYVVISSFENTAPEPQLIVEYTTP